MDQHDCQNDVCDKHVAGAGCRDDKRQADEQLQRCRKCVGKPCEGCRYAGAALLSARIGLRRRGPPKCVKNAEKRQQTACQEAVSVARCSVFFVVFKPFGNCVHVLFSVSVVCRLAALRRKNSEENQQYTDSDYSRKYVPEPLRKSRH